MKLFFTLLLLVGVIVSAKAQVAATDRTFEKARELASAENYEQAIEILEILQDSLPNNKDYKIYLARVYGWKKDYPAAIETLIPLTEAEDFSEEAIKVMVTTQVWAGNFEEVVKYSNMALTKYEKPHFQLQKAIALEALDRDEEAKETLKEMMLKEPENKEAQALQTRIFQKNKEYISLSYLNTSFSDPGFKPWHLAHLEYKKDIGNVPVLARLNYGNLFGLEGSLFEVDAYPKSGSNSYLYINAGAAINTPIFPEIKAGVEYFQSLNEKFEISLGGKYLGFQETQVILLTGGITYATENNLRFNYKPYFTHTKSNWLTSHTLALRINNPVKESFIQVDLQYGSIPYAFVTSSAFTEVTSLRLGMQYHFRITENILIQPVVMYEYEEYFPSLYRNRFNSQIITFFRF
ncbi:MAG: YaiO family outer membrane beta-barrel protein [Salegentibacter sp.]|uniref:Outer membrane protein, YaiO family n=1 Tax=Salegentibacter flavus TaxID=287099 RepID=A0A1I5CKZ6_9FLAO|nr:MULTISPECIES: YaiO family outer membrane beta-barrel protein [Salegentibacter]MDR9457992.1 YaiO family outer membrane beta-barrel protein [Salegentibacter sp.]SFN87685.1 outer membrane protein, YaiO family [Salegentibacter flavus]